MTLASGDADYYDLLGVEKTCSESEIKKVLRSRVGFRGGIEILGEGFRGGGREGGDVGGFRGWRLRFGVRGWGSGGGFEG